MLALPALAGVPKVVVTAKPVHALVAGLMEGIGTPVLIVEGTASPHTFTLKPSSAKAIQEAGVFIRVSPALEPFTVKVVEALPKSVALVTLAELPGMKNLRLRTGSTFEPHVHANEADDHEPHEHETGDHRDGHQDGDHDEDAHGAYDGHIWLDPENAKAIVKAIAEILAAKSPENAGKLKANATALNARIDKLEAQIASELAPVKDKPFIVFHDAYQYFEHHFGLNAVGSITVSPDVQPGAKRLSAVRKKISELGAACVFAEPVFQPNLVAAVTEGTLARSGTLDPEGMTLSPGPDLYFDLMTALARNLRGCLAAGG